MRLVGCTRRVSQLCCEVFSWANGGGRLHRLKLGILAGLLGIESLEGFADQFGPKWAYHLQPVIRGILLPKYDSIKLAMMDGLITEAEMEQGNVPPVEFEPSPEVLVRSHLRAFVEAKEILLRRFRRHRDWERPNLTRQSNRRAELTAEPPRPKLKSWLDYTAGEN